jgi:hypothetical protein
MPSRLTNRQSFSLWMDWKFKNFPRFKRNLLILLGLKKDVWKERSLIFLDSFTIPFNKKFGCRSSKHDWFYDSESDIWICLKCHKSENSESRKINHRQDRIQKILKM